MSGKNKYFLGRFLKNNYRVVLFNESTLQEKWSTKLSPVVLFIISVIFLSFFSITIYSLFFINPTPSSLDLKKKESLISLSLLVDSLSNKAGKQHQQYLSVKTILSGGIPVIKKDTSLLKIDEEEISQKPSVNDSLFRIKIEEEIFGGNKLNSVSGSFNLFLHTPLRGIVTESFNPSENHFGVDVVAKENSIIKSVADGVVVFSDWTESAGHVVVIHHFNGVLSVYKHNSKRFKNIGDPIISGEKICIIGNTGKFTSGPHLHFELWVNGKSIDPEKFISFQ